MKSIKLLLAAFAVSAMFAACTKEEAPVAQNLQQDQFVGAELIGTNVSVNFGTYTDTKVDGLTGDFEEGDKIGLGWIVTNAGYAADQKPTAGLFGPDLFANHMYIKENGELVTKGNMYKGWHFAYMPFQYVEKLGDALKVTVNPVQTEEYTRDAVNTNFNVSGRNFLTRESLDDNYQLKEGISFPIARATNTIKVTVKPTAMFTGSDALKNLKIKSIQIKAKEKIFPDATITLHPEYLPALTEESTKSDVYDALPSVMASAKANTTITSTIDNEDIDLSGDQALRIYTLPVAGVPVGGVNPKNVVFTIGVEGGVFTVPYVTDEEDDRYSETNKESIEAFVEAYEEDGVLTEYGTSTLKIELELNGAMFAPAFGAISSESEWNNAIAVADALELENPTFTLVNDVDADGNYEWEFTDDIKLLSDSESVLTVKGAPMVVGAEMEWPSEDYLNVEANVVVNANLRVDGEMDAAEIINNAVITVGPAGSISNSDDEALNNSNGEVIAEFGAYVYPASGEEGTIAYVVEGTTTADIYKVNTMLTHANTSVNTLIVKTALDLNAPAADATEDGRYTEGNDAAWLESLNNVNVILEGGSLIYNPKHTNEDDDNTTVKHLLARSGENTIDDVIVTTHIEVAENATLTVANTNLPDYVKSYFSEAITNEGTLKLDNVCLNVQEVDNTSGSIVATGKNHIYYSETDGYKQGGTVAGSVNYGVCKNMVVNTLAGLEEAITKASAGATVKLASNMTFTKPLKISKNLVLDLNGKTVKNTSDLWNDVADSKKDQWSLISVNGKNINVTIKGNGTVTAKKNDCYAIDVKGGANVTIENGTFVGNISAAYVHDGKLTINGGSFKIQQVDAAKKYNFTINAYDANYAAGDIVVKGGKFFNFNPAKNTAEGDPTNFLPTEGYKSSSVKESDGTWYVVSEK